MRNAKESAERIVSDDKLKVGHCFIPVKRAICYWTISDFGDYVKIIYRSSTRVSVYRIPHVEILSLIGELCALDYELVKFKTREETISD